MHISNLLEFAGIDAFCLLIGIKLFLEAIYLINPRKRNYIIYL
jgi:hypothetical protein